MKMWMTMKDDENKDGGDDATDGDGGDEGDEDGENSREGENDFGCVPGQVLRI